MDNLQKVTDELLSLVRKKNEAYGAAFEDDLNQFGPIAAAIQIGHKIKRINTLITTDTMDNGESFIDSFRDLWGYATLFLDWAERKPEKLRRR